MQELFVIDDLLSSLVGIEGRYISIKGVRGKEGYVVFQIDSSMDLALQVIHESIGSHIQRRMIWFAFN
jgi:gamma-tubulin complex component 2